MGRCSRREIIITKYFEPDVARVEIYLKGEAEKRDDCISECSRRVDNLKKALSEAGEDPDRITSSELSIFDHRETLYVKDEGVYYKRTWKHIDFEYSMNMMLEIPGPFDNIREVWFAAITADEEASINVSYTLSDEDSLKRSLLPETVKKGRERAEILAAAAGVKVGMPVLISHSSSEHIRYKKAPICSGMPDSDDEYLNLPDFNPEPINVHCNAILEWEILES